MGSILTSRIVKLASRRFFSSSRTIMTSNKATDVLIAGAGPVGLFLACELALRGVSVRVLEKESDPKSAWKDSSLGRRGLNVPSIEAFYRRGLMDKTLTMEKARPMKMQKFPGFQMAGHFAGMMLDANNVDETKWSPYHLPGPSYWPGATNWGHMEAVLAERAEELGVEILRSKPVAGVTDSGDSITVQVGEDEQFSAKWLVGCDGGRSAVRKAANINFTGTEPEFTGYLAKCELEDLSLLKPGFQYTRNGMYIMAGPEDLYAFDYDTSFDRSQPITKGHFQDVMRRISGKPVVVKELHMASSLTDRAKQAEQYRKGRIFLAGDAAHIHSPLGAQGLGLGIVDAMNLGWKLAATIKDSAPPTLLDSYEQERRPIAASVLEWCRAQTAIIRPDPHGHALAKIIHGMLATEGGTTYILEKYWGFSQRYDLSGSHPLVGMSVPDFEFGDGERLGEKMRSGKFMVIDFTNSTDVASAVKAMEPSVDYCGGAAKEMFGIKTMLVRPDGIVAWVADGDVCLAELRMEMAKWISLPQVQGDGELKN